MSFDAASIARIAAIAVAVLLIGLVLFQIALAAGVPWGLAAYGGQSAELSSSLRIASGVAAVVWSAAALIVLRRGGVSGWAPLPDAWLGVVIWVLVGLFAVSVIMNAITPSALERAIWLPVTVLLLVGTLIVAIASAGIPATAAATAGAALGTDVSSARPMAHQHNDQSVPARSAVQNSGGMSMSSQNGAGSWSQNGAGSS